MWKVPLTGLYLVLLILVQGELLEFLLILLCEPGDEVPTHCHARIHVFSSEGGNGLLIFLYQFLSLFFCLLSSLNSFASARKDR